MVNVKKAVNTASYDLKPLQQGPSAPVSDTIGMPKAPTEFSADTQKDILQQPAPFNTPGVFRLAKADLPDPKPPSDDELKKKI